MGDGVDQFGNGVSLGTWPREIRHMGLETTKEQEIIDYSWSQGQRAFLDGRPNKDNPYHDDKTRIRFEAWGNGWSAANATKNGAW